MWDMVKSGARLIGMVSFGDEKDSSGDERETEFSSLSQPNWTPDPGFMAKVRASTAGSAA